MTYVTTETEPRTTAAPTADVVAQIRAAWQAAYIEARDGGATLRDGVVAASTKIADDVDSGVLPRVERMSCGCAAGMAHGSLLSCRMGMR